MDDEPHDIFTRVSGCIQSSGIADTTAMQLLERYAAQPDLQATLQTVFTTIEGVLTGQEKTVNDYDNEIFRLTNEVRDLTTKNADLQLGLQNIAKNMTSPEAVEGKSLLADPGPFLGEEEDAVKRQKEYRSFVSLTYLKMEVDNHRFKSARHKIFYVASRIQGSAYTHIESFVNSTRTNDPSLPQFGKWEDIFNIVLNRIYDVGDRKAASEQEMATLKQGNMLFVEFYAKFTTLLADLKWNNEAKVSALKAKISYEIKDRLVSVLPKPDDDDFAKWSNLISSIAEGVEALNAEARRLPSKVTGRYTANPTTNRQQTAAEVSDAMELDTMRLSAAERAHRFQNNLCLYCGKPGHRKFNCPATKPRVQKQPFQRQHQWNSGPRQSVRAIGWDNMGNPSYMASATSATPDPSFGPQDSQLKDASPA